MSASFVCFAAAAELFGRMRATSVGFADDDPPVHSSSTLFHFFITSSCACASSAAGNKSSGARDRDSSAPVLAATARDDDVFSSRVECRSTTHQRAHEFIQRRFERAHAFVRRRQRREFVVDVFAQRAHASASILSLGVRELLKRHLHDGEFQP